MGKERTRARKHLLFFCSCCLMVLLEASGCAYSEGPRIVWNSGASQAGEEGLKWAGAFLLQGNYAASLREAEKVLENHRSLGDRALFQIGMVWASPSNPDRNLPKALETFNRLAEDYPETPLKAYNQAVTSLVEEELKREKAIHALQEENGRLKKGLSQEKEKAEGLQQKVDALAGEVQELKDQLSKLKEIDLVIEEKKNQVK